MNKRILTAALVACMSIGPAAAQGTNEKAGTVYLVSDAHLDTQWNWDIQTTIRDYVKKTLTQNLYLLGRYPKYVFNFEGATKYAWMKEYYPMEYAQVKKYVNEGRWHLTGSCWDANETVICSSESFLRNITLGQTFYRQEFQKEGTDIFLPDCFGFSYNLPTLASHAGLIGFSSQKLGWRTNPFYEGNKKYPFPVGLWQGVDGSRIMMAHGYGYGQRFKDEDLSNNEMLKRELKESPINVIYRYYGTGDTGGSPDIASVRAMEKSLKGSGPLKIISATSDQLYKDYLPFDQHPELPVADGEMAMDVHGTGCYTSQAAMKYYNRQNEHLADAAERASVAARWLGTASYPGTALTENWHRVLLHQFHDDLPGTSIPRAYEFSWNDELISLNQFSNILTTGVNGIASKMNTKVSGIPVVLYNPEAFTRQSVAQVTLPNMATSYTVTDAKGKKVASQVVVDSKNKRHLLINASVPASGAAVYSVKASGKAVNALNKSANTLENSVYRLTVDASGNISSIVDKRSNKELVEGGKAIGLFVFDDCKSYAWPAWEVLKATLDKEPVPVKDNVKVTLVENGAVRKSLRVSRTYGESVINQYIRLYEGHQADRIDIYNEVDWKSLNSMLKAVFPLAVSNEKATYDIGLGSIQRGNNKPTAYEVYAHEWTDLTDTNGAYGVTILNDSKYGWDKPNDNTLRLSLLFTPKTDRGYKYQDHQDLGYHTFTYSIIGHSGTLNQAKADIRGTELNSPIRAFESPKHKGELGKEFSFLSSNNENVIVRALKKAEVGNEYVVRVYESGGKSNQSAQLTFAGTIIKAVEADGTEKEIGAASFAGNKLNIEVRPFGVKTYRVMLDDKQLIRPKTEPLVLPFDRHCFSPNGFRNQGNFEGGYSYAAELLPDHGFTVNNVPFTFGEKDAANGVSCKGNIISLPAGNQYNKVYLLAASSKGDRKATFVVGGKKTTVDVPFYTGFYGQWGHTDHTQGYIKNADVAYIGTHRHSATQDEPYEFTYMFKYALDIPKGARQLVLPDDENVVVFAATLVNEPERISPAGALFGTNNKDNKLESEDSKRPNLLKGAKVIDKSGEVNEREKAENLFDGDEETKWCDTGDAPYYVAIDLGDAKTVSGWKLVNAGAESASYITRTCLLQGRNTENGEWQTLDMLDSNRQNEVVRNFSPVKMRYIRLFVVSPQQSGTNATRIYELEVY